MERAGPIAAWAALGVVVAGLAAYFSVVGLEDAVRTASVVGVFIGIASLALAVAVELRSRRAPVAPGTGGDPAPGTGGGPDPSPARTPPDGRSTAGPRYGGDHIDFSGGVFHGPVVGQRVERRTERPPERGPERPPARRPERPPARRPERRPGPSDGADPEAGEPPVNHPDRADHIDFGSGHFSGSVVGKMVVHHHQPSPGPVPGALFSQPAPHPGFVGRLTELDSLLDVLRPAARGGPAHGDVAAAAVAGLGGVGKTALALQTAYEAQRRGWFPGGVLFVDLHGYDGTALTPERALESLLRALGVAPEHIPPTVDERAGLYRSLLSGIAAETGPVLVLADNAAQSSQVRPLIPGHPGHRLLVTSRDTLAQLGMYQLHLGVLPSPAAMEVLTAAVRNAQPRDPRIVAERTEAERLCGLCGHLPLALQIAAALLIADPGKPIGEARR
ncbi:hypothetical protein VT50_0226910 [Streptomyces antioxidans]|uniref:NB-ARC domain-containing protein n=1 Tax=Streptomyces antioxidans TaxID=1507734 RepID=A0A1V4CZ72_9ACTN|nr:hypothetical protein [Streptomyces antioxidans]OPF74236.1 hypothetical protein VT50_0226910 [Streptomyces antioxidans]